MLSETGPVLCQVHITLCFYSFNMVVYVCFFVTYVYGSNMMLLLSQTHLPHIQHNKHSYKCTLALGHKCELEDPDCVS